MIEVLREHAGGAMPVYDCCIKGHKTSGVMSDALGKIVEVDTTRRTVYLNQGIVGVPPESDVEILKIFGLTSKLPEGEYEGYLHVLITPPERNGTRKGTLNHSGRWGAIYLLFTEMTAEETTAKKERASTMELKITNRAEGHQRVQLIIDDLVWNEITGPTAVAVSELIDKKTSFDKREMAILRTIFAGECSPIHLQEGGDYTYSIWNQGLSRDEMDAFLEKVS